jgi:hypothetical protein
MIAEHPAVEPTAVSAMGILLAYFAHPLDCLLAQSLSLAVCLQQSLGQSDGHDAVVCRPAVVAEEGELLAPMVIKLVYGTYHVTNNSA